MIMFYHLTLDVWQVRSALEDILQPLIVKVPDAKGFKSGVFLCHTSMLKKPNLSKLDANYASIVFFWIWMLVLDDWDLHL